MCFAQPALADRLCPFLQASLQLLQVDLMTRDNTIKTLRLQLAGATAYSSSSAAQLQEAQVQLQEAGELREQQEEGAAALAASRAEAQQLQQQLAKALADLEELQARWAVACCTLLLSLPCLDGF